MEAEQQAYYEEMRAADNAEQAKQNKILKRIKKRVSASWYKSVTDFLEYQDYICDFSIIDMPVGSRQQEHYRFSYIYIEQHGPGIGGDDYYGQICIPIRGGMYFSFHYSC